MMSIEAVLIDSREPAWVQELRFDDAPTTVMELETGDLHVLCDDGSLLMIERKTPDDLLNTLRDERLLPQIARLVQARIDDQSKGELVTHWPYLVIDGEITRGPDGKAMTSGRGLTGWNYSAVQGALLSAQEMGVCVVTCGEGEFEDCIIRLSKRERGLIRLLPPRPPEILGAGATFLASLPGVGIERVMRLLEWSGNMPGHAITGITDLSIDCPLELATRRKIRGMLGLKDAQEISLAFDQSNNQVLSVLPK
jgi:hypothetical protein